MPNANWSRPATNSLYTDFVTEVKNRDDDCALQFDGTTSTNLVVGTIRWDSSVNRWRKWNGTAWVELTATYALTNITSTGTITGSAFVPNGGTPPTYGMYMPNGNSVGFAINSNIRLWLNSSGLLQLYPATGTEGSFLIVGDSHNGIRVNSYSNFNTFDRSSLSLSGARGTAAAPLALATNDFFGSVRFNAWTGTTWLTTADIRAVVDGSVFSNSVPTALSFRTHAAAATLERLRITGDGQVCVGGTDQNSSTGRIHAVNTVKAWANFNGYNPGGELRGSYNVSSISDLGGRYFIQFASALPTDPTYTSDYALVGTCSADTSTAVPATVQLWGERGGPTGTGAGSNAETTGVRVTVRVPDGTAVLRSTINVAVFG